MFLTLSPPYFGNKSPRIVNKTAKNGNFRGVSGNFFEGGRKPKDFYKHLSKSVSKSIVSSFDSLLIQSEWYNRKQ